MEEQREIKAIAKEYYCELKAKATRADSSEFASFCDSAGDSVELPARTKVLTTSEFHDCESSQLEIDLDDIELDHDQVYNKV